MATEIWVNIDSGNGLLPDSSKPLPEPMSTDHQLKSSDIHIRAISEGMSQPSITNVNLKITCLKFHSNLPGANELILEFSFQIFLWARMDPSLAHCSLVTPNVVSDLGQHWIQWWLIAWWIQAITGSSVKLLSLSIRPQDFISIAFAISHKMYSKMIFLNGLWTCLVPSHYWTIGNILLIGCLGLDFIEIWIKMYIKIYF